MVAVINTVNRHRHAAALTAMHRDRYRVFVEGLKWPLPMAHDGIERDQFDTDTAVYLIDGDATQPHRGSLRLLPTTSAHLMAHAFVDLCEDGLLIGEDVWEMTRLCTCPDLDPQTALLTRQRLARAMVEFGLLMGINRFIGTTHMKYLSRLLAYGWECEPLGPAREIDGILTGAIAIRTSPECLELFRRRSGIRFPALVIEAGIAA